MNEARPTRRQAISRRQLLSAMVAACAGELLAACAGSPSPAASTAQQRLATLPGASLLPASTTALSPPPDTPFPASPTFTPAPTPSPAAATATPTPLPAYSEAPMLARLVEAGSLPPVSARLPSEPLRLQAEQPGAYLSAGDHRQSDMLTQALLPGETTADAVARWRESWLRFSRGCQNLLPGLAARIESSDQATRFTLHLRPGLRWSDGQPCSADDVVFWYEAIVLNNELSPAKPSWLAPAGKLGTVIKLDQYAVRFTFESPNGLLPLALAAGFEAGQGCPVHYLKQFHAGYAEPAPLDQAAKSAGLAGWAELFQLRRSPDRNPELPVLAPWRLEEPGPPASFERNPYYGVVDQDRRQLPYMDSVQLRPAANEEALLSWLAAGELSLQLCSGGKPPLPALQAVAGPGGYGLTVLTDEPASALAIFPNQTPSGPDLAGDSELRALLADVRLRRALNLAIDRDTINQALFGGTRPAIASLYPELQASPDRFAHLAYAPDQAASLLDELGLKRGPNGYRTRPSGATLTLTIEVQDNEEDLALCEMVSSYWQEAGLRTELHALAEENWQSLLDSGEYLLCAAPKLFAPGLLRLFSLESFAAISSGTLWAPAWGRWYESGGQQGAAPPDMVRATQALLGRIRETDDTAAQMALLAQVEGAGLQAAWEVLLLGPAPTICLAKAGAANPELWRSRSAGGAPELVSLARQ